jgi:hypothetical protein
MGCRGKWPMEGLDKESHPSYLNVNWFSLKRDATRVMIVS